MGLSLLPFCVRTEHRPVSGGRNSNRGGEGDSRSAMRSLSSVLASDGTSYLGIITPRRGKQRGGKNKASLSAYARRHRPTRNKKCRENVGSQKKTEKDRPVTPATHTLFLGHHEISHLPPTTHSTAVTKREKERAASTRSLLREGGKPLDGGNGWTGKK